MRVEVVEKLTAPRGGSALQVASVADEHEGEILEGAVLSPERGLYPIQEGVLNLLPRGPGPLSLAQQSNRLGLVARGYERPWRVSSLRLLSGEPFPPSRERHLFETMLGDVVGGGLWLDLGASTALYGRWLASRLASHVGEVIALDLAWAMLRVARQRARAEGLRNLSFVRGRGERLPFAAGSLDGVVCGASINEFGVTGADDVLREVARALRPGGTGFFMHLLTAESGVRHALQRWVATPGGIAFWSRPETNRLFEQAGLHVEDTSNFGIVAFTRVRKG